MDPELQLVADAVDIRETLDRLEKECRSVYGEVSDGENPFRPSYSYGCARTSGVAVYRKPQPKKQKHRSKSILRISKGVPCEPRQTLSNVRAAPDSKHVSSPQTSARTRTKAVSKVRGSTAVKKSTGNSRKESAGKEGQNKDIKIRGSFACKECGDIFSFRCNLLRHEERHFASANDYQCDQCGKTFSVKRNLARHLKLHMPIDPNQGLYPCDKCDKSFQRAKTLYHHKKIHASTRQYKCQFCVKTFKTLFNLQCHEDIHLNCKPYVCQFCGMAFTRSSHRTIHERIHTNERPFKCDTCDKSFIRGDHLRSHKKIHAKKESTLC